MGKKQLERSEGHSVVHYMNVVAMVIGLFSRRQELEHRMLGTKDAIVYVKPFALTYSHEASEVTPEVVWGSSIVLAEPEACGLIP